MVSGSHPCIICKRKKETSPECIYHRFPKNEQLCKKWTKVIPCEALLGKNLSHLNRSYRVCSFHFSSKNYQPPGKLCRDACPDQNLPDTIPDCPSSPNDDFSNQDDQTPAQCAASISPNVTDVIENSIPECPSSPDDDFNNFDDQTPAQCAGSVSSHVTDVIESSKELRPPTMSQLRKLGRRCVVCRGIREKCSSRKLHRFPKSLSGCKLWLMALNIPALNNIPYTTLNVSYLVCSDHFEEKQYLINGHLMHCAVPTKNLDTKHYWSLINEYASDCNDTDLCQVSQDSKTANIDLDCTYKQNADRLVLEASHGSFEEVEAPPSEVRVGPSFSNFSDDPCLMSRMPMVVMPMQGEIKREISPTEDDLSDYYYCSEDFGSDDTTQDTRGRHHKVNDVPADNDHEDTDVRCKREHVVSDDDENFCLKMEDISNDTVYVNNETTEEVLTNNATLDNTEGVNLAKEILKETSAHFAEENGRGAHSGENGECAQSGENGTGAHSEENGEGAHSKETEEGAPSQTNVDSVHFSLENTEMDHSLKEDMEDADSNILDIVAEKNMHDYTKSGNMERGIFRHSSSDISSYDANVTDDALKRADDDSTLRCLNVVQKNSAVTFQYLNKKRTSTYIQRKIIPSSVKLHETLFFINLIKGTGFKRNVRDSQTHDIDKRVFALSMYKKNRHAYKVLRPILSLPPDEEIKKLQHSIARNKHWNIEVLAALEKKALGMKIEHKLCGIVFHVFDLLSSSTKYSHDRKEPKGSSMKDAQESGSLIEDHECVCYGLVIMVKGLHKNWKYILGYSIFNWDLDVAEVKQSLLTCITMLRDIKYIAKFVVCNKEPLNESLRDLLEITSTRPYFTVGSNNIYFYFDPCDLLLDTMNQLLNANFIDRKREVRWEYIHYFLKRDSEQEYKLAPNLKFLNNNPVCSEGLIGSQNDVAVQVFSSEVAKGIQFYVTHSLFPIDAKTTAIFVNVLSQLLNCFQRSKLTKFSEQMRLLGDIAVFIRNWKLAVVNDKESELSGPMDDWLINISALKQMWRELHKKFKMKRLFTQRISQTCAEDVIATVAKLHSIDCCLSVSHFEKAIQILTRNSFQQTSYKKTFESYVGVNPFLFPIS